MRDGITPAELRSGRPVIGIAQSGGPMFDDRSVPHDQPRHHH